VIEIYIESAEAAISLQRDIHIVAHGGDPTGEHSEIFTLAMRRLLQKPLGRIALKNLSYSQARVARMKLLRDSPLNSSSGLETHSVIGQSEKLFLLSVVDELFPRGGDSTIITIGIEKGTLRAMEENQLGDRSGSGTSDIQFYLELGSEFMKDNLPSRLIADSASTGQNARYHDSRYRWQTIHAYNSDLSQILEIRKIQKHLHYGSDHEEISLESASIDNRFVYKFNTNIFVTPLSFYDVRPSEGDPESIIPGFWQNEDDQVLTDENIGNNGHGGRSLRDWAHRIKFCEINRNGQPEYAFGDDLKWVNHIAGGAGQADQDNPAPGLPSSEGIQLLPGHSEYILTTMVPILKSYAIGRLISLIAGLDFDSYEYECIDHTVKGEETRDYMGPVFDGFAMGILRGLLSRTKLTSGIPDAEKLIFFIDNLLEPIENNPGVLKIKTPANNENEISGLAAALKFRAANIVNAETGEVVGRTFIQEIKQVHAQIMMALSRSIFLNTLGREEVSLAPCRYDRIFHVVVPGPAMIKVTLLEKEMMKQNYSEAINFGDTFNGNDLRYCVKLIRDQ